MSDTQQFISEEWLNRSKNIHTADNKYDLTALVEGKYKHDAEVIFLNQMDLFSPSTTLLDLACGNGRLCQAFHNKVKWVTGTDLCEDFIVYLNEWKRANHYENMNYFSLDLLKPDFARLFAHNYSLIFLFGVSQLIIDDAHLLTVLKNIKKILTPQGRLLIKQTTSIVDQNILIDHYSQELQQRWAAHYRTQECITHLCMLAELKVLSAQPIYSKASLGSHYEKIERWDNSRQVIFDIRHA